MAKVPADIIAAFNSTTQTLIEDLRPKLADLWFSMEGMGRQEQRKPEIDGGRFHQRRSFSLSRRQLGLSSRLGGLNQTNLCRPSDGPNE